MILQAATLADIPALAAIHADSFEQPWDESAIAEVLASPGAQGWLVRDEAGAAVAFALARTIADEAELLTLAVAPHARRQGTARALVTALAGACRALSARSLFLEVAEDNPAALALYAALGFEAAGRRAGYYRRAGARADALVLRLDLNSGRP